MNDRKDQRLGTDAGFRFSPKRETAKDGRQRQAEAAGPRGSGPGPLESHLNFDTDLELPSGEDVPKPGFADRDEKRLPCNFPGMLKILIPERSFSPVSLPVRVVNLSATGAMVEVHDGTQVGKEMALANRFFELKVAHPEIPGIRGTIAWSDVKRQNPLLGLSSFEMLEEFSKVVLADDSTAGFKAPPPLPAPKIKAYPPRTRDAIVTIIGEAPEAIEVVAKGERKKFKSDVRGGTFELRVELEPDMENHFSLRSYAGARKSRAVPIRILNEMQAGPPREKTFHVEVEVNEEGNHLVRLDFCGNVQQSERILYRFSQLMASSERISFSAELESPGGFDRRLYEALRNEGALFAADTTRSRFANKILDEMF